MKYNLMFGEVYLSTIRNWHHASHAFQSMLRRKSTLFLSNPIMTVFFVSSRNPILSKIYHFGESCLRDLLILVPLFYLSLLWISLLSAIDVITVEQICPTGRGAHSSAAQGSATIPELHGRGSGKRIIQCSGT